MTNPKAFPQKYPVDPSKPWVSEDNPLDAGMDLRDYFAAKVMQALVSETGLILDTFADDAYEIADKMMVARDKRREETQTDAG